MAPHRNLVRAEHVRIPLDKPHHTPSRWNGMCIPRPVIEPLSSAKVSGVENGSNQFGAQAFKP